MKSLLSLLAIVVVCGAVLAGWSALEWCRSIEQRSEELTTQVGEMELRIFELDQQHRTWIERFACTKTRNKPLPPGGKEQVQTAQESGAIIRMTTGLPLQSTDLRR